MVDVGSIPTAPLLEEIEMNTLIILKTIISTLDAVMSILILFGSKGDRKNIRIGLGAVLFAALNIAIMWM